MENDSVDRIMQAWRQRDPKLDSSSLEVTGRLVLVAEYYQRVVAGLLQPFDLSIADFDVLNTLRRVSDPHGCKPSDLARFAMITTGAMTSRLDRLERAGLIRRAPDPDDRRGVLVQLTRQGSKVGRQALEKLIVTNREFLEPLSEQQTASIADALKQLLLRQEG
ncbi:MarR family transcriptional regulator [Kribbella sp. NPDC000426]|uniref:MarR family winged helix-turn-helix transcriptional regulator n=1 Tax=Kribbella sp. NPDC000426 TaxID=3154255 RepID=UPI00332AC4C0